MSEQNIEKAIYKFNFNCGRQGSLEGLFIAPKSHVKKLIEDEIEVYFGEVLGKHSEIYGTISGEEITFVSDNAEAIRIIEELELESGYNPFEYSAMNNAGFDDLTVGELIEQTLNDKK